MNISIENMEIDPTEDSANMSEPVIDPYDKSALVSDRGFWLISDVTTPEHAFDKKLCKVIRRFLRQEKCTTLLDLGCGLGTYCDSIETAGIKCEGYDGNPHTAELTGGKYKVLDLSVDVNLDKTFDWVLSLEVGEHIPGEFESAFIGNIVRHAKKGVILSWAVEGQGGLGHVNCRNNDYVKDIMSTHGFYPAVRTEKYFRKNAALYWFENTVMVFKRK